MYVLNIPTIIVERAGEKQRYVQGDDVSDAPADQLEAMLRLGQAVEYDPTQVVEPTSAGSVRQHKAAVADRAQDKIAKAAAKAAKAAKAESEKTDGQDDPASGDGVKANVGDWKNLPIANLELDEPTKKLLIESQLTSVQAILDFGTAHGSLTAIVGIGEGRELEIQAAITKAKGE